jgi:hypothetical protein
LFFGKKFVFSLIASDKMINFADICLSTRTINLFSGMPKFTSFIAILFVFVSFGKLQAQQTIDNNYKLYSVFIYKFTQHLSWPDDYNAGDFVIGVLGNSPIAIELQKMSKQKNIGERRIRIKQYPASVTIRDKCHIIFVAKENSSELAQVLKLFEKEPTLVITEREGLVKSGSMINFIIRNSKVQFELNQKQIERAKIKVSQNLIKVANVVN